MADRVNEAKYNAMIESLAKFSSAIKLHQSELQTLSLTATSILGEDSANSQIYKSIKDCTLAYAELAKEADRIRGLLAQELTSAKEEEKVWNSN